MVDNAPKTDRTRTVAQQAGVRYIVEPRPGLDRARNAGLAAAESDWIAYTDDDAVPDPDWAGVLLEALADPKVGGVAGIMLPLELETEAQLLFERYLGGEAGRRLAHQRRTFAPPFPAASAGQVGAGANMAFRRAALDSVGPFDEAFDGGMRTRSGGDTEMFSRLIDAGWHLVYEPRARVLHRHRRSREELRAQLFGYGVGVYAFWTHRLLHYRDRDVPRFALSTLYAHGVRRLGRSLLRRPDESSRPRARRAARLLLGSDRLFPGPPRRRRPSRSHAGRSRGSALSHGGLEVSVVIPTCGRAEILRGTLEALARQRFNRSRLEVLVVADGGDPDTLALARELAPSFPCPLTPLAQARQGQGVARNLGIERAAGRIVLMLDDDIEAVPVLVAEHARHHQHRDNIVVTGALPVERLEDEPAHQEAVRLWWAGVLADMAAPAHQPTFRDFVTGNVSAPRAALLAAGGFDPRFTGYGREDYELGYRLLRAGLRFLHEPAAEGLHRYRKPVLEWLRQFQGSGRADVIFARKHPEIAGEVLNLSPFPRVPWDATAVAASEQAVVRLNRMGGRIWETAAAFAQAAWYWRGLEEEARGRREMDWLLQSRQTGRGGAVPEKPGLLRKLPLLGRLFAARGSARGVEG